MYALVRCLKMTGGARLVQGAAQQGNPADSLHSRLISALGPRQLMHYTQFQIGFWHPFGPHGQESAEKILDRKRKEIAENGWTLWSFQRRRVLDAWHNHIMATGPDVVYVFCSEGSGAADPPNEPVPCRSYRVVGQAAWNPLPEGVRVPHPFRPGQKEASAFVVKRVVYPVAPLELPSVEWFSLKKGPWRRDRVPTRGEYLIRAGKGERIRSFRAVLILQEPYVAVVSRERA